MLACLPLSWAVPVAAENLIGEQIVVTGSRLHQDSVSAPPGVSTIDREEIIARQPADMPALLMGLPSVFIEQSGSPGALSSALIRGGDPSFSLVLVDGVAVNDPTNSRGGSFDFSMLDPYSVERVEVLRGAVSAIHGSEAVAGVINVVTQAPEREPFGRLRLALQTDRASTGTVALGTPLGSGAFALSASAQRDGDETAGDLDAASVAPKFRLALGPRTSLTASARISRYDARSFPDDSGGPRIAERRELERRDGREHAGMLQLESQPDPQWRLALRADVYRRNEHVRSPGVAPGERDPAGIPASRNTSRLQRIRSTGWLSREGAVGSLLGGAEMTRETGESTGMLDFGAFSLPTDFRLARTTGALFAQGKYATGIGLALSAAARADFTEEQNRFSTRAGALQRVGERVTLFANWSEGFRLPSFFALGHPLVGNPDLELETSDSADVGVRFAPATALTVTLTHFRSRFRRLVDFEPGPPPRLVNRSRVTSAGWEGQIEGRLAPWAGRLFLSYVETGINGTGESLRDRPEWQGGSYLAWQPSPRVTLSSTMTYVGQVRQSAIPTGDVTLRRYLLLDAACEFGLSKRLSITAAVRNITDASYETAIGFPGPGIRASVGVHARL
jgi:vitamin B12 transporter